MGTNKMTQRDRVLKWLREFGSITRAEAFTELGIVELPARITELKQEGYNIATLMETGKNRYGETVRWAKWFLMEDVNEILSDAEPR